VLGGLPEHKKVGIDHPLEAVPRTPEEGAQTALGLDILVNLLDLEKLGS